MAQTTEIYKPVDIDEKRPEGLQRLPSLPAEAASPAWPAEHSVEGPLDLHRLAVPNPALTYFLRASGSAMEGAGIYDGDLLVVDCSLEPEHGKVVIAAIYGELTVKRLEIRNKQIYLVPAAPGHEETQITGHPGAYIWGVVTHNLHKL